MLLVESFGDGLAANVGQWQPLAAEREPAASD
jgi:hypothetical protein